jgi:hypothetical protein
MNDKAGPTGAWGSGVVISPDKLEGVRGRIGVTKPCRQTNWKVADDHTKSGHQMNEVGERLETGEGVAKSGGIGWCAILYFNQYYINASHYVSYLS